MKPIVVVFILAELLDIITTVVGNTMLGTWEIFPASVAVLGHFGWVGIIVGKLIVILGVALILQKATIKSKFVWLVAIVPILTVTWNLLNIVVEFFARSI